MGVNAAWVAGVATPNIWPAGVVLCWRPPNILTSVLFFFFMGHMNLKNNTPRMHHITPFWDEKIQKFSGKGHSPRDSTPLPPTAPRFSRLRRSTCDPQCSSGVDADVWQWTFWRQLQTTSDRFTFVHCCCFCVFLERLLLWNFLICFLSWKTRLNNVKVQVYTQQNSVDMASVCEERGKRHREYLL